MGFCFGTFEPMKWTLASLSYSVSGVCFYCFSSYKCELRATALCIAYCPIKYEFSKIELSKVKLEDHKFLGSNESGSQHSLFNAKYFTEYGLKQKRRKHTKKKSQKRKLRINFRILKMEISTICYVFLYVFLLSILIFDLDKFQKCTK